MRNLFMECGYVSMNKHGQPICGDFHTTVKVGEMSTLVLSDGLGSGVKANILATLTSRILSTMVANKLPIADCIHTVAQTLPVCKVRRLAYSTFTVLQLDLEKNEAYLAQFDNPPAILLRKGRNYPYERMRHLFGEKEVDESTLSLRIGDMLILFTDGVTNVGLGKTMPGGWPYDDIVKYVEDCYSPEISAQRMAATMAEACMNLALNSLDDDVTILVYKVRPRQAVNVMIGPPENKSEDRSILRLFFSKEGLHVVCGGTTAQTVSRYLGEPVVTLSGTGTETVPAISELKGVDLVTEGVITLGRVLELAEQYAAGTRVSFDLKGKTDGASRLAKLLFEDATDINFFIGQAVNTANEELGLEIGHAVKMGFIKQIRQCLEQVGKNVRVSMC